LSFYNNKCCVCFFDIFIYPEQPLVMCGGPLFCLRGLNKNSSE
jgi:hypothetical protein